ncbi:PLP-dependent aminotransferase family protein [Paenibacillus sp. ACRRX]|uniref:MocR-like pyridoxine biosynthesis transcription factor PdxR n=1 Tax=Paenibacillus sp. ACRRX TaxID=2918206 RepID=UPI001EF5BAE9|nr:PLP-dependent aminotransferase family protein [Paenibacillus sp. ACRRX]MCG7408287.1 PLP-dependent aminotransferase family protein [Paenibacillus sp. ACRRX]
MWDRSAVSAQGTKTKQVYTLLRDRIFEGFYMAGRRLPSTRDLAHEIGVSRALIVEVYEQLIAEGYLEGRQGSGTYVVDIGGRNPFITNTHEKSISVGTREIATSYTSFKGIDFRPSFPALDLIPRQKWKESSLAVLNSAPFYDFGYADPAGNEELRTQICRFLLHDRGIQCHTSQVIVTAGATQAITLLCKLLLKPNDALATEDPTASFIRDIFESAGANIIPTPVDEHGLCVDQLPTSLSPKCVFVTPSHQFPFGSILSIGRRIQLLEYAREHNCYIIEDDYDSEFRYAGIPVRALRELDAERVVYVGTFSKNMFPALRLGYMVVPHELVTPLLQLKRLMDMHSPTLSQATLAKFMADRHLEHHIGHMKRIYGRRRNQLLTALGDTFGTGVNITGDAAGLHLVAEFPGRRFDTDLAMQLETRNIRIYPADKYTIGKGKYEDRLIMGFGNLTEAQIGKGIEAIADFLK